MKKVRKSLLSNLHSFEAAAVGEAYQQCHRTSQCLKNHQKCLISQTKITNYSLIISSLLEYYFAYETFPTIFKLCELCFANL